MRDLIFVSLEDWDEVWRRNQFLCAHWARRFPDSKILFVGPPQLWATHLREGTLSHLKRDARKTVPELPNITTTYLPKPLPNPVPGGRALNEKTALNHLKKLSHQLKLRDPLLWINPNDAGYLIGQLNERGVIYDITDDWELAAPNDSQRQWIHRRDRALCRRADLTIVCSEALYNSRLNEARRLLLLPNGVDAAHYRQVDELPRQQNWPRPVFGYTGTLHPQRIDLDLVLELAREFPEGRVVLAGPSNWPDNGLLKILESTPNLIAPGSIPYQELPALMANFDVCIVPHLQSEFTESLNPIKLWEYLACGKPIVSTDVAGFRSYPNLCRIASDHQTFLAACHAALETDNLKDARREEAKQHSWKSRLDDLLQELVASQLIDASEI